MIGLDTNVLIRLVLADDVDQYKRAVACVEAASPVLVNPIVLAEFAWALSRALKLTRDEIADHILAVLTSDDVKVVFPAAANRALSAYRTGKAGFADYFLASINAELGCEETVTFDKETLGFEEFAGVP